MLRETGLGLMPARGAVEIKIAGPLALYLFEEAAQAVRFARRLRAGLAEHEIVCRIGVAAGPVLAGETPGGGWDVAGAPVNLASKMAQDLGRPGRVYLSEAVHERLGEAGCERLGEAVHERLGEAECESAQLDRFASVRRTVSGVEMTFFEG